MTAILADAGVTHDRRTGPISPASPCPASPATIPRPPGRRSCAPCALSLSDNSGKKCPLNVGRLPPLDSRRARPDCRGDAGIARAAAGGGRGLNSRCPSEPNPPLLPAPHRRCAPGTSASVSVASSRSTTSRSTSWPGRSPGWSATTAPANRRSSASSAPCWPPTRGRSSSTARQVHFTSPAEARAAGIETVYQDLALAGNMPVWANIYLGRELTRGPQGAQHPRQAADGGRGARRC